MQRQSHSANALLKDITIQRAHTDDLKDARVELLSLPGDIKTAAPSPAQDSKSQYSMTVAGATAETMMTTLETELARRKLEKLGSVRHFVKFRHQRRFDSKRLPKDM